MAYNYEGSVTIGVWVKRSAGWQKVATRYTGVGPYTYSTGGSRTFNYTGSGSVNLGSDVQKVGLTVEGTSVGTSATVTDFTKLEWQAAGTAAGDRSATPNGQKSTVTVSP